MASMDDMHALPGAHNANHPVASKKTRTRCAAQDATSQAGKKSKKRLASVPQEILERARRDGRDGRACGLCLIKDNMFDLVLLTMLVVWAYDPYIDQLDDGNWKFTAQGYLCYICNRVFNNKYKAKYKSIEAFKVALGGNPDLLQEFKAWCQFVVEKETELFSTQLACDIGYVT